MSKKIKSHLNPKVLHKTLDKKFNQGLYLQQKGHYLEAKSIYQEILKLQPTNPDALHLIGLAYYYLREFNSAIESISEAIKINSHIAEFYSNRGLAFHAIKDKDNALKDYEKAIALRSNFAQAYANKGLLLLDNKKIESAISNFEIAILFIPEYAEAHYNLGNANMALKKYDQALNNYNHAIALNPHIIDARFNKGLALLELGKFQDALLEFDHCNTPLSRAQALICLNALGEFNEIYDRIEARAGLDDNNISIAAISSFISEKQNRMTAHNFCRNPLDFLYFSNIRYHTEDLDLFLNHTIKEITDIKSEWEPLNKSTNMGFQSEIDLFKDPFGKMIDLKSIILNELNSYYSKFKNNSCTFIEKWPSNTNITGWHVILKKQGYQSTHIHPSGWLSGVIYLKIAPALEKNEGAIEFCLGSENYKVPDINTRKKIHNPSPGDIVLFPSSLHHRTIPFTTDTDRIIVSFDLLPDEN